MILITFLICLTFAQEEIEQHFINIGDVVNGYVSPRTRNYQLYQLNIPPLNQTNLIVMIKGNNPNSDPNIYISKNNLVPLSKEEADVVACEAQGLDICFIKYQDVVDVSFVNIAVVSQFPARYTLRIDLEKDLELEQNDFLTFRMKSENQVQIIKYKLGPKDYGKTEIELIVSVTNQEELEEPFYVFMNKKQNGEPTNIKYDYIGKDTWFDNKVIEFQQQQSFEEFIILIQAEQGAKIYVTSQQFSSGQKELTPYQPIQQVVDKGEFDFYVASLDNQYLGQNTCDYSFTFIPFQGNAKMFINLNEQPPLLDNYYWQEENKQGYQILITNEELKQLNNEPKLFYIAIYGEEYCTYQLNFYCQEQQYDAYVDPQTQYFRHISHSQLPSFRIQENSNLSVIVQVKILQGKVDFLITDCNDFECPKNTTLFEQLQEIRKISERNFTLVQHNEQNFEIRLNCEYYCDWRIIAKLDDSLNMNKGHFSISYHKIEDILKLQENTPHKSYVTKQDEKYYKYFISEDDKVYRLSFLLTTIEGKATIYISRNNQKPNEDSYEFKSQNNSINLGGRFHNQPESGTYYITVHGDTECKYSITIWVIRSFEDFRQLGKFPWHYIQLYQGDPQEYSIVDDQVALFKIDLMSYTYQYKRSIIVNLQTIFGKVEMFGFTHPEINEDKYTWTSSNQLQINEFDENYPEILYLRVKIKDSFSDFSMFKISYHFQFDVIQLFEGEQYFDFIQNGEQQNFMFNFKSGKQLVITKKSEEFDQSLLNYVVDPFYGIDVTYSYNNNSILIKSNNLYYDCNYTGILCEQYFYFYLVAQADQFYSLILTNIEQNQILLIEGQPLTKVLPIVEDNYYFYAYAKDLSIQSFSYAQMKIYVNIIQEHQEKIYPNETHHYKVSKSSYVNYQAQIFLSQQELQNFNCSEYCLILTTVKCIDLNIDGLELTEYLISFNQNVTQLRQEESQEGFVEQNSYKYYSLKISEKDNNTNLMILLNPVDQCDVNLFISKNQFPTYDRNDWNSVQYLGDVIVIEAGNRIFPDMAGEYYIAVTSQENCSYIIQYRLGNYQLFDIYKNNPLQIFIEEGEIAYFLYQTNSIGKNLSVFVDSPSNTATFFVDEKSELDKGNFNKDPSKFKYNNNLIGYNEFVTLPIQNLVQSFYIIAVKAYTNEVINVQTCDGDEFVNMEVDKKYNFYLQKDEKKILQIYPSTDKITLWILSRQGLVSAQYACRDYQYQDVGVVVFNVLTVSSNWTENHYLLERPFDKWIELHVKAESDYVFVKLWYVISNENNLRTIYSIYPEYIFLQSQQQETVLYVSQNQNLTNNFTNQTIAITLFLHPMYQDLQKQHKAYKPQLLVYSRSSQTQLSQVYESLTVDLIYREYANTEQEYEIKIINNGQIEQGYWLQVGTSDLRPLIPEFKQLGSTYLHESKYFFYNLPTYQVFERLLFYEMQFCDGLFQVLASNDLEQLKDGRYHTQIQIKQNKIQYGFIKFDQQILFLRVEMYKQLNEQLKQGQFTLKIYEVSSADIVPYEKIYPGDQGYIQYSLDGQQQDDAVNLTVIYAPLNYSQTEDFTVKYIEYYLLLQDRDELDDNSFNYCVEPYNQLRYIQNETTNISTITTIASINFKQNQRLQNYVITILAKAHVELSDGQRITLDYYYESRHVRWDVKFLKQYDTWKKFKVISFVISSLIIVLAIIIYLKIRTKNQQMQLDYSNNQQQSGLELQYRNLAG